MSTWLFQHFIISYFHPCRHFPSLLFNSSIIATPICYHFLFYYDYTVHWLSSISQHTKLRVTVCADSTPGNSPPVPRPIASSLTSFKSPGSFSVSERCFLYILSLSAAGQTKDIVDPLSEEVTDPQRCVGKTSLGEPPPHTNSRRLETQQEGLLPFHVASPPASCYSCDTQGWIDRARHTCPHRRPNSNLIFLTTLELGVLPTSSGSEGRFWVWGKFLFSGKRHHL